MTLAGLLSEVDRLRGVGKVRALELVRASSQALEALSPDGFRRIIELVRRFSRLHENDQERLVDLTSRLLESDMPAESDMERVTDLILRLRSGRP